MNEICEIKKIKDENFKNKLTKILIKGNAITKLKHELSDLYEIKINMKEGNNKKMLFEIWEHFNPEDKEIEEIDEKWCK